jgi:hypothetical protein
MNLRKKFYLVEAFLVFFCFIGAVLQLSAPSSISINMVTYSFLALTAFYFIGLPVITHKDKISYGKIILCLLAAMSYMVLIMGLLFIINDWPFALEMGTTAVITIPYFIIPILLIAAFAIKDEKLTLYHLGIRSVFLSILVLIFTQLM